MLRQHFERFLISAKILTLRVPYSVEELIARTVDLCAANAFRTDIYIRPFVYKAAEHVGLSLDEGDDAVAIVAVPHVPSFDERRGLRVCVSSWRRSDDTIAPPRAKITGLYVNSALAKAEAHMNGYDEAIMLSHDGHVAEGSVQNVFLVRRGILYTPDPSQNILEGCTRQALIDISIEQFGRTVVERSIDRGELYSADEIMLVGSGSGILHVVEVDGRQIGTGRLGPVASELSSYYAALVRGERERYRDWLTPIYSS